MRRLALTIASILAVAGCASPDRPAVEPAESATGDVAATDEASLPDPSDPEAGQDTSPEAAAGGNADPATGAPAAGPGGGGSGAATASEAAATTALNAYLDGLAAEDYFKAMDASSGAPRILAFSRAMLKMTNDRNGVKPQMRYRERSFTIASAEANRVRFTGRALLDAQTRTPDGQQHNTTVSIANPTVELRNGAWLLTDYIFDGKSVVFHRGQSNDVHGGRPVTVHLVGALSYGDVTAVIIEFEADKDFEVLIEDDLLIREDRKPSSFRIIGGRYVYFSYPRQDPRPKQWQAAITVDNAWKDFIQLPF